MLVKIFIYIKVHFYCLIFDLINLFNFNISVIFLGESLSVVENTEEPKPTNTKNIGNSFFNEFPLI